MNGKGFGNGKGLGKGGGQGRNKGGAYGPGGYCVCAKCGYKQPHQQGVKCTTIRCPECGTPLIREELLNEKRKKNNKTIITAFSTSDGQILSDSHFGDANLFPVYEISKDEIKLIETVENTTEEEKEIHGDPRKAQGITQILKPYGVNVLCGRQFGKNIVRMVKKFVPVLVDTDKVDEAIKLIQNNFDIIIEEWNRGVERRHLRLK